MLKKYNILLALLFSLYISVLHADMGRVVAGNANVQEDSQKAIILHNLDKEVLILGTDLKGDEGSSILRFIPFPSEPIIELAHPDAFLNVIKLIKKHKLQFIYYSKGGPPSSEGIDIKLNKKLGAHDLTMIKIDSSEHFRNWVNDFFESKGLVTKSSYPKIEKIVDDYLQRGINYFVFDLVKLDETVRFIEPLMYRFKSTKLYYPLITSNTFGGKGDIDLILISPRTVCNPADSYFGGCFDIKRMKASTSQNINASELKDIFSEAKTFFNNQNIIMQLLSYRGAYQFNHDIFTDISDASHEAMPYEDNQNDIESLKPPIHPSFRPPWDSGDGTIVKKPAIYLYPEIESDIGVRLNIDGKLTETIPLYSDSWEVTATPDGIISRSYDYLYYEAKLNTIEIPKEGWIVEYKNLDKWFDKYLNKLGLNKKEKQQCKTYWLKALPHSKYYDIRLLSNEFLKEHMGVNINPKPDTFIRLIFYFTPLSKKLSLIEPKIVTPQRSGFTAVEWGGVLNDLKLR